MGRKKSKKIQKKSKHKFNSKKKKLNSKKNINSLSKNTQKGGDVLLVFGKLKLNDTDTQIELTEGAIKIADKDTIKYTDIKRIVIDNEDYKVGEDETAYVFENVSGNFKNFKNFKTILTTISNNESSEVQHNDHIIKINNKTLSFQPHLPNTPEPSKTRPIKHLKPKQKSDTTGEDTSATAEETGATEEEALGKCSHTKCNECVIDSRKNTGVKDKIIGWWAGDFYSHNSFGHLGFTGTSIWIDPDNEVVIVLLTNRVHPTRKNNRIYSVRRKFHNYTMKAIL